MIPSSGLANDETDSRLVVDLEFPVSPGLESRPADISLSDMIRKCQELRIWFPDAIPTREERWASKREVEFRL